MAVAIGRELQMKAGLGEMRYLLLADRGVPYLLARVRWPDVAQAITAGCPDWLDDPGLFDLPYSPSAVTVSFSQAASVAAGWGTQLRTEPAVGVASFIRRMPANWSDLSPAERRAWHIESVGRQRAPARRVRGARRAGADAGSSAVAGAGERAGAFARDGLDAILGPAASRRSHTTGVNGPGGTATERRRHARVPLNGRAHIRWGRATISAGLVDLSLAGTRCVLPEAPPALAPGATLDGPFLFEAEVTTSRICLDAAGQVIWHRSLGAGTHFGVAFGKLDDGETEGLRWLLAVASTRRGS
jgi:PilZ domain